QVQRPGRQTVLAVRQLLGVREIAVVVLDPAGLAAHVERCADVARPLLEAHALAVPGLEAPDAAAHGSPHRCSNAARLRSTSSWVSSPFSQRIASLPTIPPPE